MPKAVNDNSKNTFPIIVMQFLFFTNRMNASAGTLRAVILGLSMLPLGAEAEEKSGMNFKDYLPEIHGTVRTRVETEFGHNLPAAYRFQVRNARLSLGGKVGPVFDYYFNTDFCDQGKIKILDVWGRVNIPGGLSLRMGQFRMPFGVDPFRGPDAYIFANRSFIGRQICNVRAVGAEVRYTFSSLPLVLTGGVFNPTPIGNHMVWNTSPAYAVKATYALGRTKLSSGFQSVRPDGVRANLVDAAFTWNPTSRWTLEAEYMYKHYTSDAHKPAHGWLFWTDYKIPVKAWVFDRMSFQGRYDGMTDHSSAVCDESGELLTDDYARNRMTLGATISYIKSKYLFADIRVNYEKYFYHSATSVGQGGGDKMLLELVLRF